MADSLLQLPPALPYTSSSYCHLHLPVPTSSTTLTHKSSATTLLLSTLSMPFGAFLLFRSFFCFSSFFDSREYIYKLVLSLICTKYSIFKPLDALNEMAHRRHEKYLLCVVLIYSNTLKTYSAYCRQETLRLSEAKNILTPWRMPEVKYSSGLMVFKLSHSIPLCSLLIMKSPP